MPNRILREATIDPESIVRLPGLFCRWDIERVLEPGSEFHIEEAGETADGTSLFMVYRRDSDRSGRPETPEGGNEDSSGGPERADGQP